MRTFLKIVASATLISSLFLATSCVLLVPTEHHDNGKHKGWYKKRNSPDHRPSTKGTDEDNQEQNKNNSKGKGKKH